MLVLTAALAAVGLLRGERLGRLVTAQLGGLRGSVHVGAIHWQPRLFLDLLTNAPTPIALDDVVIKDPDGVDVLRTAHLEVKLPLRSAIKQQVALHDLKIGSGSRWRFADTKDGKDIGFLAAFAPRETPSPAATPEESSGGFSMRIVNADLDGLTATFDFPGAWGLQLRDVKGTATFVLEGGFVGWDARNLRAPGGGFLRILNEILPFDEVAINRVATTREWPNDIFLEVASARTGASTLTGKGFFNGIYDYAGSRQPPGIAMHVEFSNASDALRAIAARHNIPGLRIAGEKASIAADLSAPFSHLKIDGRISALDVGFGKYEARDLGTAFAVGSSPLSVGLRNFGVSAPDGGRFHLNALLSGGPSGTPELTAEAAFEHFATSSYLPPELKRYLAGTLEGRAELTADLGRQTASVKKIDLTLRRTRAANLPSRVHIRGQVSGSPQRVATDGLSIDVPGATARIRGGLDLARRLVEVALRLSSSDTSRLFRGMGAPPIAGSAALSLQVSGAVDGPRAQGDLLVQNVKMPGAPEVKDLRARVSLRDGTVGVNELSVSALGGNLNGNGAVRLWQGTIGHMLRTPVIDFQIDGNQIDLGTVIANAAVTGRLSFVASGRGTPQTLRLRVQMPPGAKLTIMGEGWAVGGLDVEANRKGLVVTMASLSGDAGGQIELSGEMAWAGPLAWHLVLRGIPIETLPGVDKAALAGWPIRGRLGADLHVGGSLKVPILRGEIALSEVFLRDVALGGGKLAFTSDAPGELALSGQLFNRLRLLATASLGGVTKQATATLAFDRLVAEDFLPELRAQGAHAEVAGKIKVDWTAGQSLRTEVTLDNFAVALLRTASGDAGRSDADENIELHSAGPLHATVIGLGDHISLDEARFVTQGGELRLHGSKVADALAASAVGHLDMDLLLPVVRPFARQAVQLDALTGELAVQVALSGTTGHPRIEGVLAVARPVKAKLHGLESEIGLSSGTIRVAEGVVSLNNLGITANDATLSLGGSARFDPQWLPLSFDVSATGDVDMKILTQLQPGAVDESSGRVHVVAHLGGTPVAPDLSAKIGIDHVGLRPRALGRDLMFESGSIDLTSRELTLSDIRTVVDGEGLLVIGGGGRVGRVEIKSLFPALKFGAMRLPLRGERLGYHVRDVLEIDDLRLALDLLGSPAEGLQLRGEVTIAAGRYVQDFTVNNLVIAPRTNESPVRPFYDGEPLLENLALDLRVRTIGDSFVVQNNLAPELYAVLDLHVSGTATSPRLAGDVRPTNGRFHIFGLRGHFDLVPNVNHVTFVNTKSIARGATPELNLEARSLITDSIGKEHGVSMRIHGPIGLATIDLSTDEGLDRNQTMVLLLSGRTTESTAGFGSNNPTVGANVRTGTDVMGQVTRDSVGSLIEPYIDDTLQLLTGRRFNLRPTVGADGFELRLGAHMSRQLQLQLSYLHGFQNQQRYRGELSVWMTDYFALRGIGEKLTLSPQQGIVEDFSSLRGELTIDFPLRFDLP